MSEKFLDEDLTYLEIGKKMLDSIIFDGFFITQKKFIKELKEANKPVKIDTKKILEEYINESVKKGAEKRTLLNKNRKRIREFESNSRPF